MADRRQSEVTVPKGMRVLVVEDVWIVAEDLALELEGLGCAVAGPVGGLEQGLDLAQAADLDGAFLDVNLGEETSFPIAMALQTRDVPFVFLTGYDLPQAFPAAFSEVPRLRKPVHSRDLAIALAGFVSGSS